MIPNVALSDRERVLNYLRDSVTLTAEQLAPLREHYELNKAELDLLTDDQLVRYFCEPYSVESEPQKRVVRTEWPKAELQNTLSQMTRGQLPNITFVVQDILNERGKGDFKSSLASQFNTVVYESEKIDPVSLENPLVSQMLQLMVVNNLFTPEEYAYLTTEPDPDWKPITRKEPRADELLGLVGVALENADLAAIRG